jgi:hypothetical protein
MPDTKTQADKAAEAKTAEQRQTEQDAERRQRGEEASTAAAKVLQVDPADASVNPYPAYDYLTLEQLEELAGSRNVSIPADVLKAHYITALRAADTGNPSVPERRGAR